MAETYYFHITDGSAVPPGPLASVKVSINTTSYDTFRAYTDPNGVAYVSIPYAFGVARQWSAKKTGYDTILRHEPPSLDTYLTMYLTSAPDGGGGGPTPANLTFNVEGQGEIRPQFGPYIVGQNLTVQAVPASGWAFSIFKRNGVEWTGSNPGEFLNIQDGEVITAVFIPVPNGGNGGNGEVAQGFDFAKYLPLIIIVLLLLAGLAYAASRKKRGNKKRKNHD